MASIKKGNFIDGMPNNPQLHELFMLIAYGDPLVVTEREDNGASYVIVTASHGPSSFTFTKNENGYTVVKTR
jgi:hypothetical protein